ncbi:MAG TPA: hypothetical protein DCS93_38315 [Microscillaceae bacterium]|nr:hypothetical protein [Microscillaceae bacterium]
MNTITLKKIVTLSKNDLRSIFRDKSFWAPMLAPIAILLLLRFGVPQLAIYYPEVNQYQGLILALMSCINAIFPAFFVSFIMLEEKDLQLFSVMRVMPLAPHWFIIYRISFITLMSFGFVFGTLLLSGLVALSLPKILALSFLIALMAPLTTLIIVTFAKNKIEGITMLKGINMGLALPLVAFLVMSPWTKLLAIIPVYWIYQAFDMSANFWLNTTIGIAYLGLLIAVIFRRFKNKVFR